MNPSLFRFLIINSYVKMMIGSNYDAVKRHKHPTCLHLLFLGRGNSMCFALKWEHGGLQGFDSVQLEQL